MIWSESLLAREVLEREQDSARMSRKPEEADSKGGLHCLFLWERSDWRFRFQKRREGGLCCGLVDCGGYQGPHLCRMVSVEEKSCS